jgi:hypothetical protein
MKMARWMLLMRHLTVSYGVKLPTATGTRGFGYDRRGSSARVCCEDARIFMKKVVRILKEAPPGKPPV